MFLEAAEVWRTLPLPLGRGPSPVCLGSDGVSKEQSRKRGISSLLPTFPLLPPRRYGQCVPGIYCYLVSRNICIEFTGQVRPVLIWHGFKMVKKKKKNYERLSTVLKDYKVLFLLKQFACLYVWVSECNCPWRYQSRALSLGPCVQILCHLHVLITLSSWLPLSPVTFTTVLSLGLEGTVVSTQIQIGFQVSKPCLFQHFRFLV